jgi:hypothetical protein
MGSCLPRWRSQAWKAVSAFDGCGINRTTSRAGLSSRCPDSALACPHTLRRGATIRSPARGGCWWVCLANCSLGQQPRDLLGVPTVAPCWGPNAQSREFTAHGGTISSLRVEYPRATAPWWFGEAVSIARSVRAGLRLIRIFRDHQYAQRGVRGADRGRRILVDDPLYQGG